MVGIVASAGIFGIVYGLLLALSYRIFRVRTTFLRFFGIFFMIIQVFTLAVVSRWFLLGLLLVIIYIHLFEDISYSRSLGVSLFPYIIMIGGFVAWLMIGSRLL